MKVEKKDSQVWKVTSSGGSNIQLHDDGQIWVSIGQSDHYSPGYVVNSTANIYRVLGLEKKYDKYIGIDWRLLKYADQFRIKQLRMLFQRVKKTTVGDLLVPKYGYIGCKDFQYLRHHRERVQNDFRFIYLLKESDFEMHSK